MAGHRTGPILPYGRLCTRRRDLSERRTWRSNGRSWVLQVRRRDSESSVDDLGTGRGVVLGRAVTTLRSVETQPYAWGFVLSVRRGPTNKAHTRERVLLLLYVAPLALHICTAHVAAAAAACYCTCTSSSRPLPVILVKVVVSRRGV